MMNQRFCSRFVFCSKNKSGRWADSLVVEGEGKGQISEVTERRAGEISGQITEGFSGWLQGDLPVYSGLFWFPWGEEFFKGEVPFHFLI